MTGETAAWSPSRMCRVSIKAGGFVDSSGMCEAGAACSPPHSRSRPAPPYSHCDACGWGHADMGFVCRVSIKWGCDCEYCGKWEERGTG